MDIWRIDNEAWTSLNRLLDEALERPSADRERWLADLPAEYERLKPQLRVLLARSAQMETGDFLRTLPKLDLDAEEIAGVEQPGAHVGPYRLVRELGSGGMGVVWLAERSDGLVRRPVALKLPHGAWRRAGLAERMAREREILASLTHPHIARLYDAGVTDAGQPYLAIEYVEGERIDVYCRGHGVELESKLRLFTQVVRAVAYAHEKLVVHRDLKPANILVTQDGYVRLLDFGIAKLLDDGAAHQDITEMSGRALTPDYASPELIRGEPIGVASDVYSLGVLLYELLSGARPHTLNRDASFALPQVAAAREPGRPSDVAPPGLRKALRGDLDTVVLKSLKHDPAERYPTAHALLDDIERHLNCLPVLARPDSRWYRFRKFVSRHRLPVTAATTIALALFAGAGVATWQARVALEQKAKAEAVQDFIAAVFREADPIQGRGKVLTAAELMQQAELRLRESREATPELRLALLTTIGESLYGLQENKDSARVFEEALLLSTSSRTKDPLVDARLHLGLSQTYEALGRNDEALAQLGQAFESVREAGDEGKGVLLRAKLHESALAIAMADYPRAESAAQAAIDAAKSTQGMASVDVATGLQRLSHVYTLTQRREQAVEPAKRSFEMLLAVHAGNLDHPAVIEAALYYGQALNASGDFLTATRVYRDATQRARNVFGAESRVYGEMLSALVPLETEIGDLPNAVAHARSAVDIYLREGEPGSVPHIGRMRKLGAAQLASRHSRDAAMHLEEAVKMAVASNASLEATHARGSLGLALAQLGQFDRAERELIVAIGTPGEVVSRGQHLAMRNLGTSLRMRGNHAEALEWLGKATRAAALQRSHRGDLAQGLVETALAELSLGSVAAATAHLERARTLYDDVQQDRMTPARADLLVAEASVAMAAEQWGDALAKLEKADEFWSKGGEANRWAGEAALLLGKCQRALGQHAEAVRTLRRASAALAASPLPGDAALLRQARGT
jgi:serine/threonine-protein kinase